MDLLIAQYRYRHRIPRTARRSRRCSPTGPRDVVRADLLREEGHDWPARQNILAITDAQIDECFAVRNVKVIWALDGLVKAGTYGTGGGAITDQFFPAAGVERPRAVWPGQTRDAAFKLAWFVLPEGSFQFLDGGRLDLGVIVTRPWMSQTVRTVRGNLRVRGISWLRGVPGAAAIQRRQRCAARRHSCSRAVGRATVPPSGGPPTTAPAGWACKPPYRLVPRPPDVSTKTPSGPRVAVVTSIVCTYPEGGGGSTIALFVVPVPVGSFSVFLVGCQRVDFLGAERALRCDTMTP